VLFFLQCRQVLKCAEHSSNPLSLIIFAIEACRMRIEEAKLMYRQVLSKTEDAIMVIAVILQRMRSTEDALRVLKHFIGEYLSCIYDLDHRQSGRYLSLLQLILIVLNLMHF
jgi:hypothetical protein